MRKYVRYTRGCSPNQLHPSLSQAFQKYIHANRLEILEGGILMCCETISEKQSSCKFDSLLEGDPDSTIRLASLLNAEWLTWGRHGDKSGMAINGAF